MIPITVTRSTEVLKRSKGRNGEFDLGSEYRVGDPLLQDGNLAFSQRKRSGWELRGLRNLLSSD